MNQPMKIAKPLPSEPLPGNATKDPETGNLVPKVAGKAALEADIGHNSEAVKTEAMQVFQRIQKRAEDIKDLKDEEKDDFARLREMGIPTKQARLMFNLMKLDRPDRVNFIYDFMLADQALAQGELFGTLITNEALELLTTQANGQPDPDAEPKESEEGVAAPATSAKKASPKPKKA